MIGFFHGGVVALAVAASCQAPGPSAPPQPEFVPGEVLVKFAEGTPGAAPRTRGADDPGAGVPSVAVPARAGQGGRRRLPRPVQTLRRGIDPPGRHAPGRPGVRLLHPAGPGSPEELGPGRRRDRNRAGCGRLVGVVAAARLISDHPRRNYRRRASGTFSWPRILNRSTRTRWDSVNSASSRSG